MIVLPSQRNAQVIRDRLMGKPPAPEARPIPVIEPEPFEIPEPFPKPTAEQLDAILSDDEIEWRVGVKLILSSFGENIRRLTSSNRDKHIVLCRTEVARYLRSRGWSYPRIGEFMHRDHTAILSLISPSLKKRMLRLARIAKKQHEQEEAALIKASAVFTSEGWAKPK